MYPANNLYLQLRQEVSQLSDDDILALCYGFKNTTARLHAYLDMLRTRHSQRAQFASCLICFDLARQGHTGCQQEFVYLAETMRTLRGDHTLVEALIGHDAYLQLIWEFCEATLDATDDMAPPTTDLQAPTMQLALFDHDETASFDFSIDHGQITQRLEMAIEAFLGSNREIATYDDNKGFRLQHKRDQERFDIFLQELTSLRDLHPQARGFRALTLLFYAAHLRSHGLFGSTLKKKKRLLEDGWQEFLASGDEMAHIAGILTTLHAEPDAWKTIVDMLLNQMDHHDK